MFTLMGFLSFDILKKKKKKKKNALNPELQLLNIQVGHDRIILLIYYVWGCMNNNMFLYSKTS